MSVQKKSLIGDRTAVQKAIIASKPDTTPVGEPMKAQQLSLKAKRNVHALSLKSPKATHNAITLKATKGSAKFVSFKAAKQI